MPKAVNRPKAVQTCSEIGIMHQAQAQEQRQQDHWAIDATGQDAVDQHPQAGLVEIQLAKSIGFLS